MTLLEQPVHESTMKPKLQLVPPLQLVPASATPLALPIDPSDFDGLYRRYASYVAVVAMRLIGRDAEIDDVVQDVFLQALRGLSQLRDPAAIKSWLARVTVRVAVRRLRKRKLLLALHLDTAGFDYEQIASPDTTLDQKALLAKTYAVLDQLATRTRVIWVLRHVLGEPLHEIAELCECSQSTVQRKLRDAEGLLSKELPHE